MTDEDILGLKSEASSAFRCGDYMGAATTFQRALDTIDQVSSTNAVETAKYADLELACLCNLSLAWIKLGSMAKAEEACCRALIKWPSSTKALFRRGQARLALGRPTEAATDFREVSAQEPTNTEATKMLHRALEEVNRPMSTRVDFEAQQWRGVHNGGGLTSSPSRAGTTGGGEASTKDKKRIESNTATAVDEATTTLPCALFLANSGREENERSTKTVLPQHHLESSPPASRRVLNASEQADSYSRPEDGIPTDAPEVSSFMVSDWLHSAAREQAEQKVIMDKRKPIFIDDPQQDVPSRIESCDGAAAVIDAGADASVSRLVSQLKARKASKQKNKSPRATRKTPEAESEWSRLKAEELRNVQVCRRRYEGSQAMMLANTASKRGTCPGGNACAENGGKPSSGDAAHGNGVAMQTSQWASLEEEEKQVRDAFRTKLRIGNKKNAKKKKTAVSRMRAEDPP